MASLPVTPTVTELPDSRVRVEVEVAPRELAAAIDAAARGLGANMRLPGFRKGKIPPAVLIGRIGRDAVVEEAVADRIGRWYSQAVGESGIAPVGDPTITPGEPPADGEPYRFSFEIAVRPTAKLGEWRGLEVARREPHVEEADVERQLEQARDRLARLEPVERAAQQGDFVAIDYSGTIDGEPVEGGEGRGQLLELGSGRLVPGFEDALIGALAGEERIVTVTFPPGYEPERLAGKEAIFAVTVNSVNQKVLPELDDDFASEAAGLDTLDELREEIRQSLLQSDERAVESEFRGAALDAAVAVSKVSTPEALVDAKNHEIWERAAHQFEHRGMSKDTFLRLTGKTEEEVLAEARPDAEQALKREAVLAAIIAAEQIEPTDEELIDSVLADLPPERRPQKPGERAKLLERLRRAGRLGELRENVAAERAMDLLIASAKPIEPGRAAAREKIWTPAGGGRK
jgi:trigger factor